MTNETINVPKHLWDAAMQELRNRPIMTKSVQALTAWNTKRLRDIEVVKKTADNFAAHGFTPKMVKAVNDVICELMGKSFFDDNPDINDSSTWEDMGFDSLDNVEILTKLEERLNVEIDDEASENIHNRIDLLKYLQPRVTHWE